MSQEPYPTTDRAEAGSTPAPSAGAESATEERDTGVPPSESVPDEAAERAREAEADTTGTTDPARGRDRDPSQSDPMHQAGSTSSVEAERT